jgi:YfiH family protein
MDLHHHPLPRYTSSLLSVPHGLFTSAGGVSTGPFAALNLSYHVGDREDNVRSNRAAAAAALSLSRLVSVHQVHGDRVLVVEPAHTATEPAGYDALISNLPGTGLLIQQADCQAILLEAPNGQAVAAAHCGWRGSVLNIIAATVAALCATFAVRPDSLRAVISPSLGPCCAEFIHYRTELPAWMHAYQVQPNHFDFWAISRRQLVEAGLRPEHIDTAGLCTRCRREFFSYRRAAKTGGGVTGRNGSIIGLK